MSVLIFLLVLSALVLIHEAGHFFAAKWSGVKPDEFGLGFPPRAIGWMKGEDGRWRRVKKGVVSAQKTIWSLNWLPLGGFVRLKGEQGESATDVDSFSAATRPRKFFIITAGVCMNWLLAWAIFTAGYLIGVPMDGSALPPQARVNVRYIEISQVVSPSPAASAGIRAGDQLVRIDNTTLTSADQARTTLHEASAQQTTVHLLLKRDGASLEVNPTPQTMAQLNGAKGIGIGLVDTAIVRFPFWLAPLEGARTTYLYTKRIVQGLGELLGNLVIHQKVAQDVSGPVGIAVMTGQIARQGTWALLNFVAVLSINLAVVNFLPIPGLDGGRALFLLFESIRRKRMNERVEAMIHGVGFIGLIVLILLVTVQDLRHYGGSIWHGLTTMF